MTKNPKTIAAVLVTAIWGLGVVVKGNFRDQDIIPLVGYFIFIIGYILISLEDKD